VTFPKPVRKHKRGSPPKHYYAFVASKSCVSCGATPVQLHHVRGVISPKSWQPLRSRTGVARAVVVPLCWKCHELEHAGQATYADGFLLGVAAALLAEYVLEAS
jgi:hypothetical protein